MFLAHSQRRALLSSVLSGFLGVAALPLLAQSFAVKIPPFVSLVSLASPNPIPAVESVRAMKAELAAVLAAKRKMPVSKEEREDREREARERQLVKGKKFSLAEWRERVKKEKENEEDEWGLFEAARLHLLRPRAYPFDYVDPRAQLNAMLAGSTLQPAVMASSQNKGINRSGSGTPPQVRPNAVITPDNPTWEFYGPLGGAGSWRVNGAAYDPNDPVKTFYCAAPSGGIWKTTDAGQSWTPLTDTQIGLFTSSVAVSPRNSSIVLAGTGDFDGGNGPGFGILRSTDAGRTWRVTGAQQFGSQPIHKIVFDPFTPDKVYATGAYNGLFLSFDAGLTWNYIAGPTATGGTPAIPNGRWSNISFNVTGEIIYASADEVGVFQSKDAGQTWQPVPGGPTGAGRYDVCASQITTNDANAVAPFGLPTQLPSMYQPDAALRAKHTVYIMAGGVGKDDGKIYKGEPPVGGPDKSDLTFRTLDNFPKSPPTGRPLWDQKGYNFYMGISKTIVTVDVDKSFTPNLPVHQEVRDVLVVGILGTYVSRDGGLLWQGMSNPHTDQHCITFNPTNDIFKPIEFLDGNDGGLYRFTVSSSSKLVPSPVPVPVPTPPTDPNTVAPFITSGYVSANNGLSIGQFYTSAFHPTDKNQGFGGTQDNGVQFTFSGLPGWGGGLFGDGGACGIDQFTGNYQYVSGYTPKLIDPNADPVYPMGYTPDAFNNFLDDSLFVSSDTMPFILTGDVGKADPSTPNSTGKATSQTFFAATNYLYKFDPAPAVWLKYPQRFSVNGYVTAFNTSPTDPNYLYVGTVEGRLFVSSNNGLTFRDVTAGLPNRTITHVEASQSNPNTVFVTVGGYGSSHVFRNANVQGGFWQDLSALGTQSALPDAHTSTMIVKPNTNDQEIFVGTDVGVYYTKDGGQKWQNATSSLGLPNVIIHNLSIPKGQNFLYATTFGRGIWRLPLDTTVPTPPSLTINPYLQSYRGDKTKLTLTVTFMSGGQTAFTRSGKLTAGGLFTTPLQNAALYDVYIVIPGFLHKLLRDVQLGPGIVLTVALINGDVNRDNRIDATDLAIVRRTRVGTHGSIPADVDGDNVITQNDSQIVQSNLGKVGD